MNDYLTIANSPGLWISSIPVVVMVAFQAIIYTKKSFQAAPLCGLTKQQCSKSFRVGATSAIGPALSVFIVMVGLMAVIGAPIAWLRLSIIGAAPTELTAATVGAKAIGTELGAANYGLTGYASSVWVMTLNGCGWLLFCGLFTHKLDKLMEKFTGGNIKLMTTVCGAAVLGTASYLASDHALRSTPGLTSVLTAAITMIILIKVTKNHPKIKEYNLGIAMVAGMIVAVLTLSLKG